MTDFLQASVNGLFLGGVLALVAVGLTLIFGVVDVVNFAHGNFVMLAMYGAFFAWSLFGADPLVSAIPVALILALIMWITYKIAIGPVMDGTAFAQIMVTFGLLVFIQGAAIFLFSPNSRTISNVYAGRFGWSIEGVVIDGPGSITFVTALASTGALFWFVNHTRLGMAIRATGEDRAAVGLLGINAHRMHGIVWGVSGLTVGIAGALLTMLYSVSPSSGVTFGLLAFVVIACGGFGSISGAAIAGLFLGVAQGIVGLYLPAYTLVAAMLLYLLVAIARPQGLLGSR